ncbi:MAG: O-antigen ligase family protein [Bacteroidetes bacterium]|nr:O-antigen ligase family protein [Bacteroidota bacterium]
MRFRHALLWPAPPLRSQSGLFALFSLGGIVAIFAGIVYQMWWLLAAPAALGMIWLLLLDFRKIYFLMLACIPLSVEKELPGGFATDFPSEQFMWLLTVAGLLWFLKNWKTVDARFLKHPITLALLLHLAWMTVCVVTSQNTYISIKFLLAKGWYVVVFYFLTGHMLNRPSQYKTMVWWYYVPLQLAMLIVLIRHANIGFSFTEVEYVMGPFFRNHVTYACSLAVSMPLIWFTLPWYKRYSKQWYLLVFGIVSFIIGINFSYTRAAYVALLAAVGFYWVIRLRLLKLSLIFIGCLFALGLYIVASKDNWLLFAPEYEKTITHKRFENLLEATTKLEDISTMERVYRWVAASYMIREKPFTGFGPGTFYSYYKNYTVSSFKTYVSDNPERSGIHNYYLMMAVEEGLPGLFFFLLFSVVTMISGQKIYHNTSNPELRWCLMASILCFMLTDMLMLMNDLVETDKIGSLFFMSAALLVNFDLLNQNAQTNSE